MASKTGGSVNVSIDVLDVIDECGRRASDRLREHTRSIMREPMPDDDNYQLGDSHSFPASMMVEEAFVRETEPRRPDYVLRGGELVPIINDTVVPAGTEVRSIGFALDDPREDEHGNMVFPIILNGADQGAEIREFVVTGFGVIGIPEGTLVSHSPEIGNLELAGHSAYLPIGVVRASRFNERQETIVSVEMFPRRQATALASSARVVAGSSGASIISGAWTTGGFFTQSASEPVKTDISAPKDDPPVPQEESRFKPLW